MEEPKLPEEMVDGLSDRILWPLAVIFVLFSAGSLWWTLNGPLLFFPLALGMIGFGWQRAGYFSTLGVVCVSQIINQEFGQVAFPVFLLLAVFPTALVLNLAGSKREKWLVATHFLLAMLIGTFSGNLGSAGRMFTFFTQTLNLNATTAETLVLIIRKSVHIGCYGTLAALLYILMPKDKPARWLGAALAAMTFAGFDEWRQTTAPGRTGTAWDLLWDMLGVVLALGLAMGIPKWRAKRLSGSGPAF
ncbi:MAG: VanZ family protein [Fimbriimonadaceae bacterium]|nr:VanZ family protein [Fimbriimonadaceae bacterium]